MKRRTVLIGGGILAAGGAGAAYLALSQMGTMEEYNAAVAETRSALSQKPEISDLVRFATLGANSHNTQAWKFRATTDRIEILPDFTRRTPAVDPDDHHLFASLGCAVENLALAASARGRPGLVSFNSASDGSVTLTFAGGAPAEPALFDAISRRQSTRSEYDGRVAPAADMQSLAVAAAIPGIDLILITDRPQMNRVRDFVLAGNSAQLADSSFMRELKTWLRFSPRQAFESGDGLFSASSGNPALPSWLGAPMFDLVFKANGENAKYAKQIDSSAGIAVFVSEHDDKDHWVRAGRASQRFALQATALGIKVAFVNQPVEVASLRPELAALVGMPGRRPDIVMRFGYGSALPYSARRPVEAVLL